jgi:hypothetical protein
MIRLLTHPPPPLLSARCLSFLSSFVSPVEITYGRGWGEVDEEPDHATARKLGPLQIIQYSLVITFDVIATFKNLVRACSLPCMKLLRISNLFHAFKHTLLFYFPGHLGEQILY